MKEMAILMCKKYNINVYIIIIINVYVILMIMCMWEKSYY